jgi:hypothetical protein
VSADTYSIVLKGTDTNDKFSFIDMLIPPGGGPMPHAHECEEILMPRAFQASRGNVPKDGTPSLPFSNMKCESVPQSDRALPGVRTLKEAPFVWKIHSRDLPQ